MPEANKPPSRILLDKIMSDSADPVLQLSSLHRAVQLVHADSLHKTARNQPMSISPGELIVATVAVGHQDAILQTCGLDMPLADALRGYVNLATDLHTIQNARVSAGSSGTSNALESHDRLIRYTVPFHRAAHSAADILANSRDAFSPLVRLETSLDLTEMLGETPPPRLTRTLANTAIEAIAQLQPAVLPDQLAHLAARLVKQRKIDISEHEPQVIETGLDAVDRATKLSAHQRRSYIEIFAGRTHPNSRQAGRVIDAWKTALREEHDGLQKPRQKKLCQHLPSAVAHRGPALLHAPAAEMYFSLTHPTISKLTDGMAGVSNRAADTVRSVLKFRPEAKSEPARDL